MPQVVRLPLHRPRRRGVYFSRSELNQLLSLYSRHVINGEWRDYAIDHRPGEAVFSVFRHSAQGPQFTISKIARGGGKQGVYVVSRRGQQLKRGDSITEVLEVFQRKLQLVSGGR